MPFHARGYQCLGAFDSDPVAVETYNTNLGSLARNADLANNCPAPSTKPDIVLAGPPCQGFSTAGARRPNDPRNLLIGRTVDFILKLEPKVAVLENVPAILSGSSENHWRKAETRLRSANYNVNSILIQGIDIGLCQTRKRLFMIAWKSSECTTLAVSEKAPPKLSTVLAGLGGASNHTPRLLRASTTQGIIARRIGAGQRLCDVRNSSKTVHSWSISRVFGATTAQERAVLMAVLRLRRRSRVRDFGDGDPVDIVRIDEHVGGSCEAIVRSLVEKNYLRLIDGAVEFQRTFNGKYRRADKNGVAPTVDTHFGDPSMFLHPTEHRGFTVREAARIQGFPDSFVFKGSTRQQFSLVGNAVPLPMSQQVASWIDRLLK